jgi:hypothetical protein
MSDEFTGPEPDAEAAATDAGLVERLIRDEFSEGAPAHHTWFHREGKAEAGETAGDEAAGSEVAPGDEAVADHEFVPVATETAEVPVVAAPDPPAVDETIVVSAAAIHEAFVEPTRRPRSRSHRTGMLAGLAVVGALLAVLVVFAPGGSKPRLPTQSVHDVSPIAASGPKTDAATTPSTAAPTTTSSAPATTTTTPGPRQGETITTFITYSLVPGAPAATPTTASPSTATTAPPQTTTTTVPPTTTTTAPPKHCLLVCL